MDVVERLPSANGTIGVREIQKGVASGAVKHVFVAKNCPDWLISKISGSGAKLEQFAGNERELGTALGKQFAVAMVGFKE